VPEPGLALLLVDRDSLTARIPAQVRVTRFPAPTGKIIQVLSAFAREKSASKPKQNEAPANSLPTDVQAAVTVVGTSNIAHQGRTTLIDLNHAPLAHAQLQHTCISPVRTSPARY
jgi:hypothetical protein